MSRVMVTGGAGFVGSHVTDLLLANGHTVDVVDDLSTGSLANLELARQQPNFHFHQLDLCSETAAELVRSTRHELIMLIGAQMSVKVSMRDPRLDAEVNVLGLINLMEAAVEAGTSKVVFASSGGTIYGDPMPSALPLTERVWGDPNSFYGLTKRIAGDYLRLYREHRGIDFVALALGNVYGPRQDPHGEAGVVSIFADRLGAGLPCVINGDGTTTRDYVYISDVAAAFVAAGQRGSGLVNLGTGVETSVWEVYSTLAEFFPGCPPAVYGPPLPGEVRRVALDNTRAREQLGWQPQVKFTDGAARLLAWCGLGSRS